MRWRGKQTDDAGEVAKVGAEQYTTQGRREGRSSTITMENRREGAGAHTQTMEDRVRGARAGAAS